MNLSAPGSSPEDDAKLAREIRESVEFVRQQQRAHGGKVLEVQDPERACAILALLCRGESERTIMNEIGCGVPVLHRMKREHREIVEKTRAWRAQEVTELQLRAGRAMRKKLDQLLGDEEALKRERSKDLALTYGIVTDKQRAILGETTTIHHEHRVTLEDARVAIEEAKRKVSGKVVDV